MTSSIKKAAKSKKSGAASKEARARDQRPAADSIKGAKASAQSAKESAKGLSRRAAMSFNSESAAAAATPAASGGKDTTTTKGSIPKPKLPETIGLSLSGGGAKGSFQLGALKYLYERVFGDIDPLPKVIAGTSVGAVNATKLSEGGKEAFVNLEKIWMGLERNDDMYEEQDWVTTLKLLNRKLLGNVGKDGFTFTEIVGLGLEYVFQDEIEDIDVADIKAAFARAADSKSINHLGPLAKLIDTKLDVKKVQASNIKLRLAVVYLRGGQLRYVTEKGELLERDNKTVVKWGGQVGKGLWGRGEPWYPEACQTVAKNVAATLKEIAKSKAADKDSPVGDEDKHPKKPDKSVNKEYQKAMEEAMKPLQECLKAHSVLHLKYGVLASSAIPCVFEPYRLYGEDYVDGGVREVLPIQIAIDCGASKVYAIACGKEKSEPPPYINNIADVGGRALNITLDEVVQDETTRIPKWLDKPVVLIRPNIEVHDALTIDAGLIRIAAAYGYMCAADTIELAGDDEASKKKRQEAGALADKITQYRMIHWNGEDLSARAHANTSFKSVDASAGYTSALAKLDVRKAAKERLGKGFTLPPNIERGWMSWECHRLAQFYPVLWPGPSLNNIPAACDKIKKGLKELEKQRQQIVSDLHKPDKDNQPPQKGGNAPGNPKDPDLKEIDKEIAAAKKDLWKCVIDNTPVDPRSYGLLIKSKSSDDIFILYGGSKLLLRGSDPMKEMHYDPKDVLVVPEEALARLPQDKPANGTILGNRAGDTFIMENGKKKKINVDVPDSYDPKKYDKSFTPAKQAAWEIKLVPAETLKAIP